MSQPVGLLRFADVANTWFVEASRIRAIKAKALGDGKVEAHVFFDGGEVAITTDADKFRSLLDDYDIIVRASLDVRRGRNGRS